MWCGRELRRGVSEFFLLVKVMAHSARLFLNQGIRHRIFDGHPWVFASEVARVEGKAVDGETVELRSARGDLLGSAIYNQRSQIVARRYARNIVPLDERLLSLRLDDALDLRSGVDARGSARRLVWSESDQLPGLIVDRYDEVLVLQTLTAAMARREDCIARLLLEKTGCRVILARNDAPVRHLEGLPLERKVLHGEYAAPTRDHRGHHLCARSLVRAEDRVLSRPGRKLHGSGGAGARTAHARLLHQPGRICPERDEGRRRLVPRGGSIHRGLAAG
jgi:hypothetical protein